MEQLRHAKRPAPLPEAIDVADWPTVELLRKLTGTQRMAIVAQLWEDVRSEYWAAVCAEHLDWDDDYVNQEVNARMNRDADLDILQRRVADRAYIERWAKGAGVDLR